MSPTPLPVSDAVDPRRDIYATSVPQDPTAATDQYLVAHLERRLAVPFSSLDDPSPDDAPDGPGLLLVVADGVGADDEGERASALTVQTILEHLALEIPWTLGPDPSWEENLCVQLERAFRDAEARLRTPATGAPLASALTVACVFWPRLFLAHAGDGRAYRVRDGQIETLTQEHTVAQDFVEKGILTPDEARTSRFRHVLWNVVGGTSPPVRPQVVRHSLQEGDRLLLCSDGLARSLGQEEIRNVVRAAAESREAAAELLDRSSRADQDRTALLAFFPEPVECGVRTTTGPAVLQTHARRRKPHASLAETRHAARLRSVDLGHDGEAVASS